MLFRIAFRQQFRRDVSTSSYFGFNIRSGITVALDTQHATWYHAGVVPVPVISSFGRQSRAASLEHRASAFSMHRAPPLGFSTPSPRDPGKLGPLPPAYQLLNQEELP